MLHDFLHGTAVDKRIDTYFFLYGKSEDAASSQLS